MVSHLFFMKKHLYYIISTITLFVLCGCNNTTVLKNEISIDIDHRDEISIFDLFSNIEIIRLETNDTSIIKYIDKLLVYNNNYYILDYRMSGILVFDAFGKLLYKIDNEGNGPNEYLNISDFYIYNDKLMFISAVDDRLHEYDLRGNFLSKSRLPEINGAYMYLKQMNNDTIAFWTYDYENRLKFYSKRQHRIFKESLPETDNIFNQFGTAVFPYHNYIVRPTDNRVLEIMPDCELSVGYNWNFGTQNNDAEKLKETTYFPTPKEAIDYAKKIYASEVINYFFGTAGGNSQYVYTQIMRKNKNISILYNKKTKKEYVFEKTTENANFFPLFWTEEYVIGYIPEIEEIGINDIIPDQILNEKNRAIKKGITEFNNPILIKYYFKK